MLVISKLHKFLSVNKLLNIGRLLKNMGVRWFFREVHRKAYSIMKRSIYPISIPPVEIHPELDFLLVELPPLYPPMLLPNGIGYVNNILKKCEIRFQVLPLNIIFYHRYHSQRILKSIDPVITESGYIMKEDPWNTKNIREWDVPEVIEYFWSQLEEIIKTIVVKRPKAVGISVHGANRTLAKKFVEVLRSKMPAVSIVVGGYDCVYRETGPSLFPDFDYMVIGEAELTLDPLVKALSRGEKPKDLPGIISRYDSPDRKWVPSPLLEDLDAVDFPKYEWTDLSLYRTYNNDHFVPITASRGCRWGRCRFCAECFLFRKRNPEKVADEIEFMNLRGFYKFYFNESDVNGDPQNLYNICSEIIRRRLKVQFFGQLRIDKRNTREYFHHLAKAGFAHLRFGVDGWSNNTLRLQRKGYNMNLVFQNLRDCSKTGIFTSVNMVLGVPGETEDDISEMIANIVYCKDYIFSVDTVSTLILAGGSEYYRNPDQHKIYFRGNKEDIYKNHPYFIPTDLWYSEDPYIDQEVRVRRLNKICIALYKQDVKIGPLASIIVENLKREQKHKAA